MVVLDDKPFLVRHNAKEGRFGLEDEEKFWVKRATDLSDGLLTDDHLQNLTQDTRDLLARFRTLEKT